MEGSVTVDGYDTEEMDSQEETQEKTTSSAPSNSNDDSTDDNKSEENEAEKPAETTFKGTKVDPNPESAVHQELANTKRLVQQMNEVLKSPELLSQYMEKAGFNKKSEVPESPAFTADNVQKAEDVIKALNDMDAKFKSAESGYKKEIENLRGELSRITEGREIESRVNGMKSDAATIREKYPELRDGTATYSKELEEKVGELFARFGLTNDLPNGRMTLAEAADIVMSNYQVAKQKGSVEAQTVVKEKQLGKAVGSGTKGKSAPTESSDPDTIIAQRISGLFRK